ncbi:uncharacterized protein FFNC_15321 [Fusarium fujikuroi]|nr:uncharacterized protein FFE2_15960 [Fusarium fujikuroi]SCO54069.1 uncharacterized protein FFNC_15321 [Fusarium fujikuroi]
MPTRILSLLPSPPGQPKVEICWPSILVGFGQDILEVNSPGSFKTSFDLLSSTRSCSLGTSVAFLSTKDRAMKCLPEKMYLSIPKVMRTIMSAVRDVVEDAIEGEADRCCRFSCIGELWVSLWR